MNWDQFQGNWKQVVGKAKEPWGLLTDEDLDGHRSASESWFEPGPPKA